MITLEPEPWLAAALVMLIGVALRPAPLPRTPLDPAPATLPATRRRRAPFRRRNRRTGAGDAMAVATWCDDLARAVRSGATLVAAIRSTASHSGSGGAAADICFALDRGRPLTDALHAADSHSSHVNLVITVLRACAEHGGAAAEPLDRAAATLRSRAADRADRLTHSAQARLSAVVMTSLPLAMLVLMLLTSRSVRAIVVAPLGAVTVAIGGALNVLGWVWMRSAIDRGVR